MFEIVARVSITIAYVFWTDVFLIGLVRLQIVSDRSQVGDFQNEDLLPIFSAI